MKEELLVLGKIYNGGCIFLLLIPLKIKYSAI